MMTKQKCSRKAQYHIKMNPKTTLPETVELGGLVNTVMLKHSNLVFTVIKVTFVTSVTFFIEIHKLKICCGKVTERRAAW